MTSGGVPRCSLWIKFFMDAGGEQVRLRPPWVTMGPAWRLCLATMPHGVAARP
jgi:hypothetical protein